MTAFGNFTTGGLGQKSGSRGLWRQRRESHFSSFFDDQKGCVSSPLRKNQGFRLGLVEGPDSTSCIACVVSWRSPKNRDWILMASIDLVNPCRKTKAKQLVAMRDKLPQLTGLYERRTPRKSIDRITTVLAADSPWIIIMRHPRQNNTHFQWFALNTQGTRYNTIHNIQWQPFGPTSAPIALNFIALRQCLFFSHYASSRCFQALPVILKARWTMSLTNSTRSQHSLRANHGQSLNSTDL